MNVYGIEVMLSIVPDSGLVVLFQVSVKLKALLVPSITAIPLSTPLHVILVAVALAVTVQLTLQRDQSESLLSNLLR